MVAGIALEGQHRKQVACRIDGWVVAETGSLHHTVAEDVHTRSEGVHFQCSSSRQHRPARLIEYWGTDLTLAVVQTEAARTWY